MTKTIRKRFLSVILTLAMVISLMPALTLTASAGTGGTILEAGDIAFVGINTDGDDDFAFLLLKDIEVGFCIKPGRRDLAMGTYRNRTAGCRNRGPC